MSESIEGQTTVNAYTPATTAERTAEERGHGSADYRYDADEDMKRLGVDKKLVVISSNFDINSLGEAVMSKLNEVLVNEYGCDFVVEFLSMYITDVNYSYLDALKDTKSMGQQADIIVSASSAAGAAYSELVDNGLLMELTEYLETVGEGRKLYGKLSGQAWNGVRYNGRIYGCASHMRIYNKFALICNKDVADTLGLEVEKGFSFYDIGAVLGELKEGENTENILRIYTYWQDLPKMLGYFEVTDRAMEGYGVCAVKDGNGEWSAFNPLLEDEFIRLCKTVRGYREKGWLVYNGEHTKETSAALKEGKWLFYCQQLSSGSDYIDDTMVRLTADKTVHEAVPGEMRYDYVWPAEAGVTGVASWSEYKEEALKLLTLLQTEERICNLIAWGVEGKDYIYENREVAEAFPDKMRSGGQGAGCSFINQLLLYPQFTEPDNKEGYYKELAETLEVNPFFQYGISEAEYKAAVSPYANTELKDIYREYYKGLLEGRFDDVDAAVAEALRLQTEAGMNELIEQINRMFKEADYE